MESEIIDGSNHTNRLKHLLACIPDLFDYKTMLYFGDLDDLQMFNEFVNRNYVCDVLEPYYYNIIKLKDVKGIRGIHKSDFELFKTTDKYDVVFIWHRMDRINRSNIYKIVSKIDKFTNHLIIFGMPYEKDTFYLVNFECDSIGKIKTNRSNFIAWKQK